jgi:hypothetical protein
MTPSETAYKAAEVISQRGHCKDLLEDEQGRVCFLGALNVAWTGSARGFDFPYPVVDAAYRILLERNYEDGPVFYNNEDFTSAEDVILLLKQCGERLA